MKQIDRSTHNSPNKTNADSLKQPLWVIRAGEKRQANNILLSHGRIVLAEPGLGDLSKISPTRDGFLAAYRAIRPNDSPSGSATIAKGKFYRFVYDMKCQDTVLYLSVKEQHVYVGTVTGEYLYDKEFSSDYPHQRTVRWRFVFPKTALSEPARRELGAARSFYMYKRHVPEVLSVVNSSATYTFGAWNNRAK